jgi:hypothetical protein
MPFRESIFEISPPWLAEEGGIAEAIQYAEGITIDAIGDWMIESVKASMPGEGTPDALYLIGRDMQIDRGPNETDDHYIDRLRRAVDSHRVKGSGPELLKQLLAWFSPSVATPLRLVSNAAVWHEIDLVTEVVTKTVVGTNWTWDSYTPTRWWRGWVIIDSSVGPWTVDIWDLVGLWGDGGTWGSDATVDEIAQLRRIIDRWKPAHITCMNIIVTFTATNFEVADASPPNPSGTSDTPAWRLGYNAIFWTGI